MSAAGRICDSCARRSWLVGRLAGHLEAIRGRRHGLREVLALDDDRLIAALAGAGQDAIREERAAIGADELRERWQVAGAFGLCRHDEAYPPSLRDLSDAPAVLHGIGDAGLVDELLGGRNAPPVAVVGTRRASASGQATATALGRGLSAAGLTVVSGMALGIDSAAHEGAMQRGARTVAVLACGPEHAYPPRRRDLHRRLAGEALVISELPPGVTPFRWAFPARNRIIAALAAMTVVVEAAQRSGSLITAEIAVDLGREVGAVPGPADAWHSAGSNALLRDGAHVIRDAADVLDDLLGTDRAVGAAGSPVELAPDLARLLALVDRGAASADALVRVGATPGSVLAALTELELLGLVERRPGGVYARRSA